MIDELQFEWDPDKEKNNLAKHGVRFAKAADISALHIFKRGMIARIMAKSVLLRTGSRKGASTELLTPGAATKRSASSARKKRTDESERPTMVRYSMTQIREMITRGEVQDDPNAPEAEDDLPLDFWKNAKIVYPSGKTSVHLRLDTDVVEWFREHGKGHLTRMNAVLRSYMEAHKGAA